MNNYPVTSSGVLILSLQNVSTINQNVWIKRSNEDGLDTWTSKLCRPQQPFWGGRNGCEIFTPLQVTFQVVFLNPNKSRYRFNTFSVDLSNDISDQVLRLLQMSLFQRRKELILTIELPEVFEGKNTFCLKRFVFITQ